MAESMMDNGIDLFVPGVNCDECGRFVGRDGSICIEYFEMSREIAGVDGTCRRCIVEASGGAE